MEKREVRVQVLVEPCLEKDELEQCHTCCPYRDGSLCQLFGDKIRDGRVQACIDAELSYTPPEVEQVGSMHNLAPKA